MVETHVLIAGQSYAAGQLSLPKNRAFRAAWRVNGTVVEIDMPTARGIFRERLRAARKPKLEALDAAARIYRKDPERLDEIDTEAQRLRDLPNDPRIDAAESVEALEALWPADFT